jgi:SAM-dependent methyltransferase
MRKPTNADAIAAWSEYPSDLIDSYGEAGDLIRQHLLNPTIFSLLGEVRDKRILDAGCGQGYLCRLLARQGARMTGVEPAEPFYRYAIRREEQEWLGIDYVQADLSIWTPPADPFDAVIANMADLQHNVILPLPFSFPVCVAPTPRARQLGSRVHRADPRAHARLRAGKGLGAHRSPIGR